MPALPSSNPAQFVQGAPVLHVANVEATAAFYRDVLGFTWDFGDEAYAVVWRDNSAIHFVRGNGGPRGVHLFQWVKDVDAYFREIVDRGAAPDTRKGELRMRLRHSLCCVLAASWAVTASASQSPPAESDQQVIIGLERGWNEAFYHRDVAFIGNILADDFTATYEDGNRGDKARELALTAEFNQQVESAIQDEFKVRVYRDTAVVWFTLRVVGIRQGRRSELTLRYTDVWVMREGRWQCVSTHSTKVNAG